MHSTGWFEPEFSTSIFPLELMLVQPHTGTVSPQPTFTLCIKWHSFRECNSYSKSHEHNTQNSQRWNCELCVSSSAPSRKLPKGFCCPLVETLVWYQIQLLFQNNAFMLLASSLKLLLNLRLLVWEEKVSLIVWKAPVIWAITSWIKAKWSQCWDFYVVWILVQTLARLLIDYFFFSSHTLDTHNCYTN